MTERKTEFLSVPEGGNVTPEQGGLPGQVLTALQDSSAKYVYPAVIDATQLPEAYYSQSSRFSQRLCIDILHPIIGRIAMPSITTTVRIYNGDTLLGSVSVGTPNEIEVRTVKNTAVLFISKFINGNVVRYDYSTESNAFVEKTYSMLPVVTADDNGKTLQVVDGKWTLV